MAERKPAKSQRPLDRFDLAELAAKDVTIRQQRTRAARHFTSLLCLGFEHLSLSLSSIRLACSLLARNQRSGDEGLARRKAGANGVSARPRLKL